MTELNKQLADGKNLAADQVAAAAAFLVDPAASAADKASFLRSLARKGETPDEIAAFVREFLKLAVDPGIDPATAPGPMLDVVGTGGDRLHLFNVSTTAMFIMAAGGVCVVKHGNRGITSKAGGADVLEALGIKIDLPKEQLAGKVHCHGIGFIFAPLYHPAFKAVAEARKMLAAEGQRSIFNILGPLLNPARPAHQLIGVFDASLLMPFAEILKSLGRQAAWVVHGSTADGRGMDELSTLGPNRVAKLAAGRITEEQIDPQALGLAKSSLDALVGGDAKENAAILEAILSGRDRGPRRDIAVLNAAAGLVITAKAPDLPAGIALAGELIDRSAAMAKLDAMRM